MFRFFSKSKSAEFDPSERALSTYELDLLARIESLQAANATLRSQLESCQVDLRIAQGDLIVARTEAKSLVAVVERDRLRVAAEAAGFAIQVAKAGPRGAS